MPPQPQSDPNLSIDRITHEIWLAHSHIACTASDTGCVGNGDDIPPIGKLPPGVDAFRFWLVDTRSAINLTDGDAIGWVSKAILEGLALAAPPSMNYDRPEVRQILERMLSVRRMGKAELFGLGHDIQQLPSRIGKAEGGIVAATLITRIGQALGSPEDFPPLLTNNELRRCYRTYSGISTGFSASKDLVALGTGGAISANMMKFKENILPKLPGFAGKIIVIAHPLGRVGSTARL
jgi:hypothetical protein